jgi:microcystin-dependent protein
MKSTILLLTTIALLFTSNIVNAQITTTGMAIQGIARDASNNAITNAAIGLEFTVHYTKAGSDVALAPATASLTTDAFGVFSYVLDMSAIENTLFYDYQLKLKIRQTSPDVEISDEDLRFVPYAVSASNGVPTGSIMPFAGSVAPRGWVLCNGDNGTPDLRDRFVIGAGGAYSTGTTGGSANAVVVSHSHSETHSLSVTDPGHSHTYRGSNPSGVGSPGSTDTSPGEAANTVNLTSTAAETGISVGMSLTINSSGESGTNKNLPPYYALCYVMRLS